MQRRRVVLEERSQLLGSGDPRVKREPSVGRYSRRATVSALPCKGNQARPACRPQTKPEYRPAKACSQRQRHVVAGSGGVRSVERASVAAWIACCVDSRWRSDDRPPLLAAKPIADYGPSETTAAPARWGTRPDTRAPGGAAVCGGAGASEKSSAPRARGSLPLRKCALAVAGVAARAHDAARMVYAR